MIELPALTVYQITGSDGYRIGAVVDGVGQSSAMTEAQAREALGRIQSYPALLKALEGLLTHRFGYEPAHSQAWENARAAIAKAKACCDTCGKPYRNPGATCDDCLSADLGSVDHEGGA